MYIWRRHGWQALFMQQKHGTNPNILAFFRWYAVSITWFGVYNIEGNNTQMFPSSYLWPVFYLRFIFKMFEQNDLGAFFFFLLEGSHVHCTHMRGFKKWIVVCQKEKDKRIPSWHMTVDLMRYVCSRRFMSISFSPKPKVKQRSCSQNNLSKPAPLLMKALSSVSFLLSCCSSLGYQKGL